MYGYIQGEVGTGMDTQRVRWVHVWTHTIRETKSFGYMYGYIQGEDSTCMVTYRVRWVQVWTHRG